MATEGSSNRNLMAAAAYLLGPITGIVLLLGERNNAFVRFHAMQSTIVFGGLVLINIVLGLVPILGWIVALLLSPLLLIGGFILWIFLMWKAYSGEKYKLPYFGDLAERQLARLK